MNYAATMQFKLGKVNMHDIVHFKDPIQYFTTPSVPVGKYLLNVWRMCAHMHENELTAQYDFSSQVACDDDFTHTTLQSLIQSGSQSVSR